MFNDLQIRAKERLTTLAEQVSQVNPKGEFKVEFPIRHILDNHEKMILDLKKSINRGSPYIYYLTVIDNTCLSDLRNAFSEARNGDSGRAYARLNHHESSCLYVGSSSDLLKRIKEHFGYGAKATFALHLAWWAENFSDSTLTLAFSEFDPNTDAEALQALEDTLWSEMKPMFGRRGSK